MTDLAQRNTSLLGLTSEFVEILSILEQEGADEEREQQLNEVAQQLVRKFDRCAWTVKDIEDLAERRRQEAASLYDQVSKLKGVAARLKMAMLDAMRATDQQRIVTGRHTISIRQNPESVIVNDLSLVPEEFIKPRKLTEEDVSKTAVKDLWKKTGLIAPGCDIARGERVQIQ